MYELRSTPLLPRQVFLGRMLKFLGLALGLITVSLLVGTWGYHGIAGLGWVDALYNASMIMAGMGPVNPMPTDGAKLFASGYALFCGIVFLALIGIVIAPIAHRVLHSIHLEEEDEKGDGDK